MGLSIEEQRELIRQQKADQGEFVSVVKTKRPKKKKDKLNKKRNKTKVKANKPIKKTYKDKYYKYLNSTEWANIKLDVMQHRGKACELCGSNLNLQLHHKTYENAFEEEPEDLILLCRNCHKEQHKL